MYPYDRGVPCRSPLDQTKTGVGEVYVQPFPPTGGKYQISRGGGALPMWRADGSELYFVSFADRHLMVVRVDGRRQEFEAGVPERLFTLSIRADPVGPQRQYAVSRDGRRFLINLNGSTSAEPITVTVNWLAAVQK